MKVFGNSLFGKVVAGMALALLGGCTVGPNYQAPNAEAPKSFGSTSQPTTASATAVTSNSAEIAQWWKSLNDAELDHLIDSAIDANLDLKLATLRLREARARRGAITNDQPNINANASYSHQRLSQDSEPFASVEPGALPFEFDLWQVGFDSTWELDVFGGTRRALEAANAEIGAGMEDQRDVLVSVTAEVARNYVELRGYQRQLDITQRNLSTQRETLEVTKNQEQQGVATHLDVARAAAQAAATEAELPALEKKQWQAIHRIAVLLGKEPNALANELSNHSQIPVPQSRQLAIGVPSELLRRRPDVRRAERQIASATARVGVATADLFPKFTLTGTLGVQSSETGTLFNYPSRYFNLMPGVSVPLFDGGRRKALLEVSRVQQGESLVRYEQTVLRALGETEDAVVALQTEERREASLKESVDGYQEAADLSLDLYRQGLTDFLTVLEAQRNLYVEQDALARSERTVTTNLIALYKSLGGGWEATLPDASNHSPTTEPSQP